MIPIYPVANPYELDRQAQLDLIIGRMVRQLIECEWMHATPQLFATIEAIKDTAIRDAERSGLDAATVRKIAASVRYPR